MLRDVLSCALCFVVAVFVALVAETYLPPAVAQSTGCICGTGDEPPCELVFEVDKDTKSALSDTCGNEMGCAAVIPVETIDYHYVHSSEGILYGSDGYAFDDNVDSCPSGYTCNGDGVAQAVANQSSWRRITWTVVDHCDGCVGKIRAEFNPEVHLCANLHNPDEYAFIGASMGVETSVKDIIFDEGHVYGTEAEPYLEAAGGGESYTGGGISLTILGQTVDITGNVGTEDTDSIEPGPITRWYEWDGTTAWEFEMKFSAGVGVDVLAVASWAGWVDIGEGWVKSSMGTWDHETKAWCKDECCGWNYDTDEVKKWDLQKDIEVSPPSCTGYP